MQARFGDDIHSPPEQSPELPFEVYLVEEVRAFPKPHQKIQIARTSRLTSADRSEHTDVSSPMSTCDPEDVVSVLSDDLFGPEPRTGSKGLYNPRSVPSRRLATRADPDHRLRRAPGISAAEAAKNRDLHELHVHALREQQSDANKFTLR